MAHRTRQTAYSNMEARLNKFPQGAPPSPLLTKILKILVTEKEANLISQIPIKPFTAKQAAKIWKMDLTESQKVLDELASRAMLIDSDQKGETLYVLPPPMAGFFEFSMMRIRDDIDQKALSELFYQYLNVEEDFVRELFTEGDTQLGRVFVNETVLPDEEAIHVLDYERATEVIKTASAIGVSTCYCRHKMMHMGQACDAPLDICMTFNGSAESLVRHGHARQIDVTECMDLLHQAYDHKLVQFGENVRNRVAFICNCCGCCCEAMIAARRFALLNPVHTTNFIPGITIPNCTGCGNCVSVCPVEALSLVSANDPKNPKRKIAILDENLCLGCGLCLRECNQGAITLKSRPERVITPMNTVHRSVVMAIERGKLQNLIFDNQVLFSHRALAAVLGVILKLPPIKQIMASKQMKSRYLERIISKHY
ncbi:MAG: 4Fe-4S dicluster domain-containing protein [Candidatus Marinimicrobia bacterium]|nr:4Fe-4S dicluster domain-containing protein [Candidatus Neomarinimicrobiota bacterium]